MTEDSTDRTAAPGFILLLIMLVTAGVVYVCQAHNEVKYEGVYPAVRPLIQGKFSFMGDRVEIKLSENPVSERIVIFAYDKEGRQLCILKPVYDQTVTVRPGEFSDYWVSFTDGVVDDFGVITKTRGFPQGEDFFSLLSQARASSRRYGVQQCLYPLCTRCLDVCPVIKHGVIKMHVCKDGRINPVIHIEGCPRCGKCFEVCKVGVIMKSTDVPMTTPKVTAPPEPIKMPTEKELEGLTF